MALPGDLTTITVTGTYRDGAGNPLSGTVLFTPSNEITDQAGKVILAQVAIPFSLTSGAFTTGTTPLACTDNANLQPQGWWWNVNVAVAGAQATFAAYLPSTLGATVDMSQIVPQVALPTATVTSPSSAPTTFAQQAGGLSVPFVSSVNGQSGNVTVAGSTSAANTWTAVNTFSLSVQVPEGVNAYMGTAVLNGVTPVTVATTAVIARSRIFLTTQAAGGTPGTPYVGTITANTSFTVLSTSAADTSTVAWLIINHT